MTETSTETEHQDAAPDKPEQQPAEKTLTQAEVDRIVKERLSRQRQQEFGDYDDLKAKAQRLQEIEDANKSETQKLTDQLTSLQQQLTEKDAEVAKATLSSLKASVAAEKGVLASALTGTTKEELEASADDLIAWRDAVKPNRKPPTSAGLKSGASSSADSSANPQERAAAAVRALRRGGA